MFCVAYALIGVPYFYYLMKITGDILHASVKKVEEKNQSSIQIIFKRNAYFSISKTTGILLYILVGFVLLSIIPAGIFSRIEDWHFSDAFYFTIITLLTIGFGDSTPTAGKLSTSLTFV